MTVQELIDELEKHPRDYQVIIGSKRKPERVRFTPVEKVWEDEYVPETQSEGELGIGHHNCVVIRGVDLNIK